VKYKKKKKNYSIFEVPVQLLHRKLGKSKMKINHIFYSLMYLFKIYIFKK